VVNGHCIDLSQGNIFLHFTPENAKVNTKLYCICATKTDAKLQSTFSTGIAYEPQGQYWIE